MLGENDISYLVRGASFKIHKQLGPGLLESVYENILAHEMRKEGCIVKTQVAVPVKYDDIYLELGFRLDLLIDDLVVVEIKSVEKIHDIHFKQLLTYLRFTGCKLGLLINFNSTDISKSIFRVVNNL
jgi:GxxExxY protein